MKLSKEKNENIYNKYSFIAAISYFIVFIYQLVMMIYNGIDYFNFIGLLNLLIYLGIAVLLFVGNKKKELLIISGVRILLSISAFVANPFILSFLMLVFTISMFVSILMSLKQHLLINRVWYIPSLLLIAVLISTWTRLDMLTFFNFYWPSILIDITRVIGCLFIGLWLRIDSTL